MFIHEKYKCISNQVLDSQPASKNVCCRWRETLWVPQCHFVSRPIGRISQIQRRFNLNVQTNGKGQKNPLNPLQRHKLNVSQKHCGHVGETLYIRCESRMSFYLDKQITQEYRDDVTGLRTRAWTAPAAKGTESFSWIKAVNFTHNFLHKINVW